MIKHFKLIISLIVLLNTLFICANANNAQTSFQAIMTQYQSTYGGKIGVAAIDTSNNSLLTYHANDHFPLCSTFKFILVSAILKKSSTHPNLLNKRIHYTQKDLANCYSPYTNNTKNLKTGMTIRQLAHAAILSDGSASNILINELGGLDKLNQFAKAIDNDTFILKSYEPEVNHTKPGSLNDSSTPYDMAKSMENLVLGNILDKPQRQLLKAWLINNTTGNNRIRAGVPNNWVVGDKTGTCDYGATNDVAIIWPPNHAPIILSIYYVQKDKNAKPNEEVIQLVTKAVRKSNLY